MAMILVLSISVPTCAAAANAPGMDNYSSGGGGTVLIG
jgi:hypothetical protein